MVEISPKALRFARLAAEQQRSLARDARVAALRTSEAARRNGAERGGYVAIPDDLAAFCLEAVSSLLGDDQRLAANDWDENDLLFMRAFAHSLRDQLTASVAGAR